MMYDRLRVAWQRAALADEVHVCGFHQESATGRNLYHQMGNLANLQAALTQFLADIGAIAQEAVPHEELLEHGIEPVDASAKDIVQVGGKQKVAFNTVREVRKKLPGTGVVYVPPDAEERRLREERHQQARELLPPLEKRFWG